MKLSYYMFKVSTYPICLVSLKMLQDIRISNYADVRHNKYRT